MSETRPLFNQAQPNERRIIEFSAGRYVAQRFNGASWIAGAAIEQHEGDWLIHGIGEIFVAPDLDYALDAALYRGYLDLPHHQFCECFECRNDEKPESETDHA